MTESAKNKWDSIIFVLCLVIAYCSGYYIGKYNYPHSFDNPNVTIQDTVYNVKLLDSIKYNIKHKDSVIVNLKKEMKYEIDKAVTATDSVAVRQFTELAGAA